MMFILNHCAIIIARSGASLLNNFSRKDSVIRQQLTSFPRCRRRPYHNSTAKLAHSDSADDAGTTNTPSTSNRQCSYPQCAIQVPPPPSWSIHELRLASSDNSDDDDKISEEELATLARRCLIDVRQLSPERREELRKHVGGIMRCASVLLESKDLNTSMTDGCIDDDNNRSKSMRLTDEEVYDAPRGLTKMPIRRVNENDDPWRMYDSKESNAVMQSQSVRSKMMKSDNGDMYFSVVTKR